MYNAQELGESPKHFLRVESAKWEAIDNSLIFFLRQSPSLLDVSLEPRFYLTALEKNRFFSKAAR